MSWQPGWDALIVTAVLGWVSGMLGLLLYRHSKSTVKQQGVRFSGASAIAIVMYLVMTRFYVSVHAQLHPPPKVDPAALQMVLQNFETCVEQEGGHFQCKQPAMELRDLCSQFAPPR